MLKQSRLPLAVFVVVAAWLFASCADMSDFLAERTHPDGWVDEASESFHGKFVLESADPSESCQSCHGRDFSGGTSGVACASCHALYPHADGFASPASGSFHEAYFQDMLDWDITKCQACHDEDYGEEMIVVTPGAAPISCLDCHQAEDGPENCATCHGSAANDAPPQDLQDNTSSSSDGVGAHQEHLGAQITAAIDCAECHVEPDDFDDPGHVVDDSTPGMAEIVFGALATHGGASPSYDFATSTCGASYCHGGFAFAKADAGTNAFAYLGDFITGNSVSVVWDEVGTGQADCGTCHGLPPEGHIPATACNTCHPRVVDAENNIIDTTLHINGQKDVF